MAITDSVGENGINQLGDVNLIHDLLHSVPEQDGGPLWRLSPHGWTDFTDTAIKKFQWRQFHLSPNHSGLYNPTYKQLPTMRPSGGSGLYYGQVRPNDVTHQQLLSPTHWSPPPGVRGGINSSDPPLLFTDMWNHINNRWQLFFQHRSDLGDVDRFRNNSAFLDGFWQQFNPQLIIAIFWEETGFRNMQGTGVASNRWGFGQVLNTMISAYNTRYQAILDSTGRRRFPTHRNGIIGQANFEVSIDLYIVALLDHWWGCFGTWRTHGTGPNMLDRVLTALGASRPTRTHWTTCMRQLSDLGLTQNLIRIQDRTGVRIREALYAARPGNILQMSPDLAFPF